METWAIVIIVLGGLCICCGIVACFVFCCEQCKNKEKGYGDGDDEKKEGGKEGENEKSSKPSDQKDENEGGL